jgi:hypothetical protein
MREEEAAGREKRGTRRAGEGRVTTRERGGRLVPGETERQRVSETEQLPSVCEDGEEGRGEEEEKRTGQDRQTVAGEAP